METKVKTKEMETIRLVSEFRYVTYRICCSRKFVFRILESHEKLYERIKNHSTLYR